MNPEAAAQWDRAKKALESATVLMKVDADGLRDYRPLAAHLAAQRMKSSASSRG
jgi:hypothetical protein